MHLAHATLRGVAPFGDLEVDFRDEHGEPRAVTVVHGGAGVGKTTLLQALACTRPGNATVASGLSPADEGMPQVRCSWHLGEDEPSRPHPLVVSTPGTSGPSAGPDDEGAMQRREQALFDRRAREQGGFVFLLFPANRWFSRQAVSLHAPQRSVMRYDVRATTTFDQASSADLTRETKQALAYAAIASALSAGSPREHTPGRARVDPRVLGVAMRETVDGIVRLTGLRYEGLHPLSFEPRFLSAGGRHLEFDALPTRTRHLVAYAAITIKTLWAAYPTTDPRTAEGVVAIDDADLHQDAHVLAELITTLRTALMGVQWILTTASPQLAASAAPGQVLALRRLSEDDHVSLFLDDHARTH